jgi:hypothetical protein
MFHVYLRWHLCIWHYIHSSQSYGVLRLKNMMGIKVEWWWGFSLWDWGLNSGLYTYRQTLYPMSHTSSPSCSDYFGYGVSWTTCPGWPWSMVLLLSASQVARHEPLAPGIWWGFLQQQPLSQGCGLVTPSIDLTNHVQVMVGVSGCCIHLGMGAWPGESSPTSQNSQYSFSFASPDSSL